jgi:hypothetical protein
VSETEECSVVESSGVHRLRVTGVGVMATRLLLVLPRAIVRAHVIRERTCHQRDLDRTTRHRGGTTAHGVELTATKTITRDEYCEDTVYATRSESAINQCIQSAFDSESDGMAMKGL